MKKKCTKCQYFTIENSIDPNRQIKWGGYVWMGSEMNLETKRLYVENTKVLLKVCCKILMTFLGGSLIFAENPCYEIIVS